MRRGVPSHEKVQGKRTLQRCDNACYEMQVPPHGDHLMSQDTTDKLADAVEAGIRLIPGGFSESTRHPLHGRENRAYGAPRELDEASGSTDDGLEASEDGDGHQLATGGVNGFIGDPVAVGELASRAGLVQTLQRLNQAKHNIIDLVVQKVAKYTICRVLEHEQQQLGVLQGDVA